MTYNELFDLFLQQALKRHMGTLSQEKIDMLDAMGFPWDYYEEELYKSGLIEEEIIKKEKEGIK